VRSKCMSTSATACAYFDSALNAWVLTQYADVLTALREPQLSPIAPQRKGESDNPDENLPLQRRAEIQASLSHLRPLDLRSQIKVMADNMIDLLPADRPIDLVREFIRPWCLAITTLVTGTDVAYRQSLAHIARDLPGGDTECRNSALRSSVVKGLTELNDSFRRGGVPVCKLAFRTILQMLQYSSASVSIGIRRRLAKAKFERLLKEDKALNKSVFLGTSQTLPSFLSNAWLALLSHPTQYARLRAEPHLIYRAVAELLRYANIVHTLRRQATSDLELGGVFIRRGELVVLKLDAANRDPAHFADPDRLDLDRAVTSEVALGAGPHSCLGASIVRTAVPTATRALVQTFAQANLCGTAEWYTDSVLRFPVSLDVVLRRR